MRAAFDAIEAEKGRADRARAAARQAEASALAGRPFELGAAHASLATTFGNDARAKLGDDGAGLDATGRAALLDLQGCALRAWREATPTFTDARDAALKEAARRRAGESPAEDDERNLYGHAAVTVRRAALNRARADYVAALREASASGEPPPAALQRAKAAGEAFDEAVRDEERTMAPETYAIDLARTISKIDRAVELFTEATGLLRGGAARRGGGE